MNGVKEALLTLAPLSQFELGVSMSFLNQKSGVIKTNASLLKKLEKHGKIVCKNGFYSIPHSTLAQLYMETALHYTDENGVSSLLINLIDEFKESVFSGDVKNYPLEILQAYLKNNPRNYGEVVNRVCGYEAGVFRRKDDLRYIVDRFREKRNIPLRTLLLDDKTYEALIKSLQQSDLRNLGLFLCGIHSAANVPWIPDLKNHTKKLKDYADENAFLEKQDVKKFTKNIDTGALISKIEEESNVNTIAYCFAGIMLSFDKDFHRTFLDNLNHSKIKATIKNSDASFLDTVSTINPLLMMDKNFWDTYKDVLIYKAREETNLFALGDGLQGLFSGSNEIANNLCANELLLKFEKESDLSNISLCLNYVTGIVLNNESCAQRLVEIIPPKINAEKELVTIMYTLGRIGGYKRIGMETVDKIIDRMKKDLFKSKINDKNRLFLEGAWIHFPEDKEGIKLIYDKLKLWDLMDEKSRKSTEDFLHSRGQFKNV
jgi:hypothetical protein